MLSQFELNFYAKILVARGFCVEISKEHLLINSKKYTDIKLLEKLVLAHPRIDITF